MIKVCKNNFSAAWGFYHIDDLPDTNWNHLPCSPNEGNSLHHWPTYVVFNKLQGRMTNETNCLFVIPLFSMIYGIYQALNADNNGSFVKATLSAMGLGPVLLFVDLAIFFKRLYDARINRSFQEGLRRRVDNWKVERRTRIPFTYNKDKKNELKANCCCHRTWTVLDTGNGYVFTEKNSMITI